MDFIITKTTNATYGVSGVDTPEQASLAFKAGDATQIGQTETLNVQPRPQPAQTVVPTGIPIQAVQPLKRPTG